MFDFDKMGDALAAMERTAKVIDNLLTEQRVTNVLLAELTASVRVGSNPSYWTPSSQDADFILREAYTADRMRADDGR